MPIPDRQSGPTPGAAGGSQSPGRPRADKPRVGSWTGRASASQLAGVRGVPHLDRSPGPKRPKSAAAAQPRAKAEAIGRDWPTPRLGRRSGATQQAGTDVALTRAAIQGALHCRAASGSRPPRARAGSHFTIGLCPCNRNDGLGRSCRRCGQGRTFSDHTQGRGGVAKSAQRGCKRQSPLGLGPTSTLTVNVTTAKKNGKDGGPTSCVLLAGGKLRQLFFPHFRSFLLNAAEPTQVDENRSGYAGVHIQTSRSPESRAAAQRRLGCEGPLAQ